MTAFKGTGIYGDGAGVTTPLDMKLGQAGQVAKASATTIRAGLFWPGTATIVSGKANMSYDVAAFAGVTQRSASAGAVFGGNDGTLNVATDVTGAALTAPGSNSRYHLVFWWQREFSLDGTDSNPVISVLQGTAAASPTVPSLASYPGAIELARILVPAGVTATNTGTTITQTGQFTAMAGGVIPFRTTTERDTGTFVEGQPGWLIDSDQFIIYSGSRWIAMAGAEYLSTTPFSATTTVTIDNLPTWFTGFTFEIVSTGTAATLSAVLRTTAPADVVTLYDRTALLGRNVTPETSTPITQTSWGVMPVSNTSHHHKLEVEGLTQALATSALHWGGVNANPAVQDNTNAVFVQRLSHRTPTAYGGIKFTFSANQTGYVRVVGKL
jgi:hypothetical protein